MADRLGNQRTAVLGQHAALDLPVDEPPTALDLLSSLGHAAVLLDDKAECIGFNSRAAQLFGRDLRISAGRISAADRGSSELLKELIRTGVSGIATTHSLLLPPVVIRRREGRPVVAQVLHASGAVGPRGKPARAILLLTPLDAAPEIPQTRLMLLFKLTPAEARLAARLCTGEPLEDIARVLDVSLGTARNQLKAIFSKTETKRQAELVALLWRVSELAISTSLLPG